jgi:hypothetical protein
LLVDRVRIGAEVAVSRGVGRILRIDRTTATVICRSGVGDVGVQARP